MSYLINTTQSQPQSHAIELVPTSAPVLQLHYSHCRSRLLPLIRRQSLVRCEHQHATNCIEPHWQHTKPGPKIKTRPEGSGEQTLGKCNKCNDDKNKHKQCTRSILTEWSTLRSTHWRGDSQPVALGQLTTGAAHSLQSTCDQIDNLPPCCTCSNAFNRFATNCHQRKQTKRTLFDQLYRRKVLCQLRSVSSSVSPMSLSLLCPMYDIT